MKTKDIEKRTDAEKSKGRSGFTMVELIVALGISLLVSLAMITTFVWCLDQAALCSRIGWSQNEAMRTSALLTEYLRNASEIVSIDTAEGEWVEIRFPDGETVKLRYLNAIYLIRDGQMILERESGTELIVARGLTEIMDSGGYTTPIFRSQRPDLLRIAYRVSEPVAEGGRDTNDEPYAARVRFAVCLRNAEKPVEAVEDEG